jgi:hypothetical protein
MARIAQNRQAGEPGHELPEQSEALRHQIRRHLAVPGDVPAATRETRHQSGLDRVDDVRQDDRHCPGHVPERKRGRGSGGHDDADLESKQVGRGGRELTVVVREPVLDEDGPVREMSQLA